MPDRSTVRSSARRREVGEIGRGPQSFDALEVAHPIESSLVLADLRSEPGELVTEPDAPGTPILEDAGDHHDRGDRGQRQELRLT